VFLYLILVSNLKAPYRLPVVHQCLFVNMDEALHFAGDNTFGLIGLIKEPLSCSGDRRF